MILHALLSCVTSRLASAFQRGESRACRHAPFRVGAIVAAVLALACGGSRDAQVEAPPRAPARATQGAVPGARAQRDRGARAQARADVGFRTRAQADQHFRKHGAEFGRVTEAEYIRLAAALRDAAVGGSVEEIRRPDGTVSRYDRASGAFIAFDADGTIRTFFKPNTGESYFRRQAMRAH